MAGWPWPLDGVQRWFEDLWGWISEAAATAVSIVSTWINDAISSLWTTVSGAFSSLWTSITGALSGIWNSLVTTFSNLWTSISTGLGNLWGSITGALGSLWTSVSGALSGIWTSIVDTFSSLWTSISQGLGSLWTGITSAVGGLWDSVSGALGNLWTGFVEWGGSLVSNITTMFDGAMSAIGSWVGEALAGVARALGEALSGFANWFIAGLKGLAQTLAAGLEALMDVVGAILGPIILGFVDKLRETFKPGSPEEPLKRAVDEMVKTTQNRVLDELKKIYKSPFDPAQVIAISAGIAGLVIAAQVGVHGLASAAGIEIMGTRIDLTDVVESAVETMGLSRIVTSSFLMPLDVGLFTPLRYAYNQMFTPLIPPVMDLIRFVVREVITPEEFAATMPYHGFSPKWATAYWDAHWVLPAYGQIADAFHRGILSAAERDKFIVWHDYSPESRPGIAVSDLAIMAGLLKTLIPRVDLRYGWEMGRITDADLVHRYELLGYEEDSELMADIQKARALTEEIHKVRDEWIRDFIEGYILEDLLRANLAEIGIGPLRIDYYVTYAKMRRGREHNKRLLGIYEDAYFKDLKTYEELTADAMPILVDPDALDLFLTEAYIRKYKKPKGEVGD